MNRKCPTHPKYLILTDQTECSACVIERLEKEWSE